MLNASSAVVVPGTIMASSIARTRSNRMFTVCSGETVPGTISALYTALSCLACSGVMSSSSSMSPRRKRGSTLLAHCRLRIAPGQVLPGTLVHWPGNRVW